MSNLCVIFDLDGTLVDSENLCNQAFLDLLPQLNLSLGDLLTRFRGRKMALIVAELEQILGTPLTADFVPKYREHVAHLFATSLQPMPGVLEMLEQLRYPYCIASSGPIAKIRGALTVTGLLPWFERRIFSAYEVGSWKPEPGLFLHAAKTMGFEPCRCVVVEDSLVGIEAAQAAHMYAMQFLPEGGQAEAHPHATCFDNMAALPALLNAYTTTLHEGVDLAS